MTRLSPEEIAEYAYGAGFRGHALTTAVAVAMAESGGKVEAHNDLPPDNSYGLWQINMYGSLGPDRRREYDLDSNRELLDPEANAEVAHRVWRADGSFMAWSAYRFGNYRQFLDEARRAARAVARDGGSGGSGGSGGAGSGSGGFAVDTDLLGAYVRRTRAVAHTLDDVAERRARARARRSDRRRSPAPGHGRRRAHAPGAAGRAARRPCAPPSRGTPG